MGWKLRVLGVRYRVVGEVKGFYGRLRGLGEVKSFLRKLRASLGKLKGDADNTVENRFVRFKKLKIISET